MESTTQIADDAYLIGPEDMILITGATGFIGVKVVESLLERGFRNLRCFARPSSKTAELKALVGRYRGARIETVTGNLLSRDDCATGARNAAVIIHLAAGTGQKYYADAYMNSVVTTRNLLEAAHADRSLRRFVSISSFAVYSNRNNPTRRLLDETCAVEDQPVLRGEAYCYAKVRQEEFVREYCEKAGMPYVILRPGSVYGPGRDVLAGRIGLDSFGVFLHMGGSNTIPFTYVDNCAEAIALAGVRPGIDNEIFNIVDDDLPSSRQFLRGYKKNVKSFHSFYVPHWMSYLMCIAWERYSYWSEGQLPPAFNRGRWHAYWKKTRYSNQKLKARTGWKPKISIAQGSKLYFESCRERETYA